MKRACRRTSLWTTVLGTNQYVPCINAIFLDDGVGEAGCIEQASVHTNQLDLWVPVTIVSSVAVWLLLIFLFFFTTRNRYWSFLEVWWIFQDHQYAFSLHFHFQWPFLVERWHTDMTLERWHILAFVTTVMILWNESSRSTARLDRKYSNDVLQALLIVAKPHWISHKYAQWPVELFSSST